MNHHSYSFNLILAVKYNLVFDNEIILIKVFDYFVSLKNA